MSKKKYTRDDVESLLTKYLKNEVELTEVCNKAFLKVLLFDILDLSTVGMSHENRSTLYTFVVNNIFTFKQEHPHETSSKSLKTWLLASVKVKIDELSVLSGSLTPLTEIKMEEDVASGSSVGETSSNSREHLHTEEVDSFENVTEHTPILTIDALVHLFQYLDDFDDLKAVSLVCKQWLHATQIPKILKFYKLCISFVSVGSGSRTPLSLFANSNRMFSNIYFENVKFSEIDGDFWSRWSETISEVTFDYKFSTPDLPGMNFLKLLLYTPKLKTLNLICSLHLCNRFLEELTEEERKTVYKHLKNVQELQMYFSEVCIDTLEFRPWLDEMPNLKNIDFDFYCKKAPIPPRTYEKIFYFLNLYGSKVKGLHICDHARPVDKSVVDRLLFVNGMKLKAFDHIINRATSKTFTDFLCTQSELQYLTVNGSFSLSRSFQHMPKLKEFAIANGPAFDGFEVFNHVPKLQSIGIAGLEFYNEDDLDDTFKLEKNLNMKELSLIDASISFELPLIRRLCESFPNLRVLNLDAALIDDAGLQFIFQLTKLQELKLSKTQITDAGLMGSPAEEKRKGKKRKLSHETDSTQGYSINALKELEVLNIDFCKKITEKSYLTFQFKKLKHLSAQGNTMTAAIFRSLGKQCPIIESLNLSKCNSLRDKETEAIAKNILGLETLELQACSHFNKACLTMLMRNCKKLQTLDVSKCDCDVKTIAHNMFSEIKSLRRIMLEKERLYRCNFITTE